MNISLDLMLKALPIMGQGMLGIFAVTLVIILSVTLLNKFTQEKTDDNATE